MENTWTYQTGGTPSTDTGPSAAYDGAYYLFTEVTGHLSEFFILDVVPTLTAQTDYTLSLRYHMHGAETGWLAIEMAPADCETGTTWEELPNM